MLSIHFKSDRPMIETNQNFRLELSVKNILYDVEMIQAIGNSKRHIENMFGWKFDNEVIYFSGDTAINILLNW